MNRCRDAFERLLGGLSGMIDLMEDYQLSEQKNVALAYICQTE